MRQNIRVDIVYYLCDTDFEMEFNLNGCCPMRMLKGSAADRGALVKNLAKAVQRSRVIMCCGPLFGGDGLIGLVAASIGRNTERVNCEEYGIITASDISVIEGSVPLVTPDGYFGGCIIESGPQTIVLLSENRNIRKVLMNNLIHPYLEEISMIPDLSQRMKSKMQENANAQNEPATPIAPTSPVAPVTPVTSEIDAEKAAADAAAIVAAALGETAVAAAEVAETADIIEDISSNSASAETEAEETPAEEEEITPADMELQIEEVAETEQLSLDLSEETEEETEEASENMVVAPVGEEINEENTDAPVIIGMVPPEDDNLFANEETEEESAEEQTEEAAEEAVEEVTEKVAEEKTEEPVRKGNSLFVAEVIFDKDEMPSEDQFMKTDFNEVELYVEPGAVTRKKMNDYAREYVPSKSDEMFLSGDDEYEYDYDFDSGKKKFSINTPIAILVVLLVLILLVLGYVLIYVPYSQGLDFEQYMDQLFSAAFISPFFK